MGKPRFVDITDCVSKVLDWPCVDAQNAGQAPRGRVENDVDHGGDAEKAVQVEVPLDETACGAKECQEPLKLSEDLLDPNAVVRGAGRRLGVQCTGSMIH